MDAPPVLTPERIDAMLSIMAEVCLEGVVEAGQRQKTADDPEAFDRCGRTLQRACRNLRQTIAMKQRHDREQDRKAEDGRRLAVEDRKDAVRVRNEATTIRRAQVRRHFDRVLWDEYEPDEVEDLLDDVELRLRHMVLDDDFLDAPLETLIQRLADEIGIGEETADDPPDPAPGPEKPSPPCGERVGSGGVGAGPAGSHPHPRPRRDQRRTPPPKKPLVPAQAGTHAEVRTAPGHSGGSAWVPAGAGTSGDVAHPEGQAPSGGTSAPHSDGPAAEAAPPDPPPDPPPEPPPEPYIPPWEKLRPGQIMPGGTGW